MAESVAQTHLSDSLFSLLAGNYSGSYRGDDAGSWTVIVDAAGNVSGAGRIGFSGEAFSISGTIFTSGASTADASGISNIGSKSSWNGSINISTGEFSGSWGTINTSPAFGGTFTGSKN